MVVERFGKKTPVTGGRKPDIESRPDVLKFSPRTLEVLKDSGYTVYELSGRSVQSLRAEGRKFLSVWHTGNDKIEAATSRLSEVAVCPREFFLKNSGGRSLTQQELMVSEFSKNLKSKLKLRDVQVAIGTLPDYVDLAFAHADATGEELVGGIVYARTTTQTDSQAGPCLGARSAQELNIRDWFFGGGDRSVRAAPLIFPTVV